MRLLDRMKKMAREMAASAPDLAQKALAFGSAAVASTTGALGDLRDFATDRLRGSHFSEVDVEQAAGAMSLFPLWIKDADGTLRKPTEDELHQMARIMLVATLEDDDPQDGQV